MEPLVYNTLSKSALFRIFESLDRLYSSVSLNNGVLKAEIPKIGTYIVNRQPPKQEMWLSSPLSGPHHFKYQNSRWVSSSGQDLMKVLSKELLI
ncbi:frataxin [Nematocida displodere]|uniref:Frataxin n=1 Tax=Nematocida displodere TaxID=1805483 RepID=A0A177EBA1_9MICR|nr:frataxin [Nematocida displodere]